MESTRFSVLKWREQRNAELFIQEEGQQDCSGQASCHVSITDPSMLNSEVLPVGECGAEKNRFGGRV